MYRISCKVSRAIFNNLSLLGATSFQGFHGFYLINKPFWCDYVLRATMYRGRISIQEIRYLDHIHMNAKMHLNKKLGPKPGSVQTMLFDA